MNNTNYDLLLFKISDYTIYFLTINIYDLEYLNVFLNTRDFIQEHQLAIV